MAAEGSGSSGKRPMFVDLDVPVEEVVPTVEASMASGSSNPSSSNRKKSKKPPNPDWPPQEYLQECRVIGMEFYKRRSFDMLKRSTWKRTLKVTTSSLKIYGRSLRQSWRHLRNSTIIRIISCF
jgi:hypothetical protein